MPARERQTAQEIPVWDGTRCPGQPKKSASSGPNGEKVDVMTFRGSFERDLKDFVERDAEFQEAVEAEDDDAVETILQRAVLSTGRRCSTRRTSSSISYGVPAPTPAFVYNALGKKPLPTRRQIVADTVDSIAARFNLRYNEQKWVDATAQLLADDPDGPRAVHGRRYDALHAPASSTNWAGISALCASSTSASRCLRRCASRRWCASRCGWR